MMPPRVLLTFQAEKAHSQIMSSISSSRIWQEKKFCLLFLIFWYSEISGENELWFSSLGLGFFSCFGFFFLSPNWSAEHHYTHCFPWSKLESPISASPKKHPLITPSWRHVTAKRISQHIFWQKGLLCELQSTWKHFAFTDLSRRHLIFVFTS